MKAPVAALMLAPAGSPVLRLYVNGKIGLLESYAYCDISSVKVLPRSTAWLGMGRMPGGSTELTCTVNISVIVSGGALLSATMTVNEYVVSAWFDAVGQVRRPVFGSIVAPVGNSPATRL